MAAYLRNFTITVKYKNIQQMPHIVIISASVRTGRKSQRVALFFKDYLAKNNFASAEILDLDEYNFPIFNERLRLQTNPQPAVLQFAEKINSAEAVIIVTPEYNGGYPASLKNVIDLLYNEWKRKPIAIAAISDGIFGGTQVVTSLQFTLWKIGAWTVPVRFHVQNVDTSFNEDGVPADKTASEKNANIVVSELL